LHASAAATALAAAPDRRPYDPSANMAQGVQVNAPKAFQRKLVDGADSNTTRRDRLNQQLQLAWQLLRLIDFIGTSREF